LSVIIVLHQFVSKPPNFDPAEWFRKIRPGRRAGNIARDNWFGITETTQEAKMGNNSPSDGAPGTTDQSPRWEGPEENRPRGYLKPKDDPERDRDAVGENLRDPRKKRVSDAMKTKDDQ